MDRPVASLETARALVAAPVWTAVRTFLWDFLPLVHPSRLAPLAARCRGFDLATPATLPPRIKASLLSELGVTPVFHDFPATDRSRFLLLPSATLDSIARWLGALSCATALRRVTSGPAVRALRTALPGIYPDLFTYAPWFDRHPVAPASPDAEAPAPEAIPARGRALLLNHLSALPAPLLHRFRLLFPPDAEPAPDPDLPAPPPPEAVTLLLKLKFPEAHALCSS